MRRRPRRRRRDPEPLRRSGRPPRCRGSAAAPARGPPRAARPRRCRPVPRRRSRPPRRRRPTRDPHRGGSATRAPGRGPSPSRARLSRVVVNESVREATWHSASSTAYAATGVETRPPASPPPAPSPAPSRASARQLPAPPVRRLRGGRWAERVAGREVDTVDEQLDPAVRHQRHRVVVVAELARWSAGPPASRPSRAGRRRRTAGPSRRPSPRCGRRRHDRPRWRSRSGAGPRGRRRRARRRGSAPARPRDAAGIRHQQRAGVVGDLLQRPVGPARVQVGPRLLAERRGLALDALGKRAGPPGLVVGTGLLR